MNRLQIRPLTVADTTMAAALKLSTWPEEVSDPTQISSALQSPSHQAFLALVDETPAGLVSCFLTTSQAGIIRWEIDLLLVHPDFRRKGIASQLIKTAVKAGQSTNASMSRGLIATDNVGSQKSFASQEYKSDKVIQTLFICSRPIESRVQNENNAHFVPVSTFSYVGIWLEGTLSSEAFSAAQNRCLQANLNLVGLLISETDQVNQEKAKTHAFDPVGTFQWWQRTL